MSLSMEDRLKAEGLVDKLFEITGSAYRDDGSPRTFLEIEDRVGEVASMMAASVIQKTVAEQTKRPDSDTAEKAECCPKCGRPGTDRGGEDDEPMILQTDHGDVEFIAKGYFCRRCRRSFFPSLGRTGAAS